jgi:hypothetical protein
MQSTSLFLEAALGQKGIPIPFSGKTEKSNFLIKNRNRKISSNQNKFQKKREKSSYNQTPCM